MNRRDLIKIGASVAAVPVHRQQPAAFSPKFFDAHQNESVVALRDLIIPATDTAGAKGARSLFVRSFNSLDRAAPDQYNEPFVERSKHHWSAAKSIRSCHRHATSTGYLGSNKAWRVPQSFGCNHPEHA
jgi:hypothetical protein